MLKRYKTSSVEVPADYSREKALQYANTHSDVRGGYVNTVPEADARVEMYKLHMKIGATNELPKEKNLRDSFLNDFWITLYLRNNLCPGDIPFGIIIQEFTTALVLGEVDRKGNNQGAICAAFNDWITREKVRHRLYRLRDEAFPNQKPKQVAEKATPSTVQDYSDDELRQKLKDIEPMKGIKMVNQMIEELEAEINRRGIDKNPKNEVKKRGVKVEKGVEADS